MVGNHGTLFGESLDVLRLLLQVAHGDKEGEIGVLVAGFLEHAVEHGLHIFPESVTPRFDHHAASDAWRGFGQVGGLDHLLVPLRVVLFAGGLDGRLRSFRHGSIELLGGRAPSRRSRRPGRREPLGQPSRDRLPQNGACEPGILGEGSRRGQVGRGGPRPLGWARRLGAAAASSGTETCWQAKRHCGGSVQNRPGGKPWPGKPWPGELWSGELWSGELWSGELSRRRIASHGGCPLIALSGVIVR